MEGPDVTQASIARDRLERLFGFLREFDRLRHPIVRDVGQLEFRLWLDELPEHKSIERGWLDDDAEYVLRITRPTLTEGPEPPAILANWLEHGWQNPESGVSVLEERQQAAVVLGDPEPVEQFSEDAERVSAFEAWRVRRDEWAAMELPARRAMLAFERLYRLHGVLDRERERFELLAGDALLDWNTRSGEVHHPIVLQGMQLDFEAAVPRFTISEGDRPPELYTALLRAIDEIDGQVLGHANDEFAAGQYSPLSGHEIDGFLSGLAARFHAQGVFDATGPPHGRGDVPAIGRRCVLFLRPRTQGFSIALEAIAQDLPTREDLPNSLLSIVGLEPPESRGPSPTPTFAGFRSPNADPDILFTKPANEEQAQIARRLERYRAVMVQGPPGTGKTHTIANLVGHLLAQGKRVLVTSHTAKALERVREVIVPDLQPLAVSVVGGDAAGRSQLEQSVQAITDRLSSDNAEQLRADAEQRRLRRAGVIQELNEARTALEEAVASEYQDIVFDGTGIHPADAAREVARGATVNDWIPGPIATGAGFGLTVQEVFELYRTNSSVSAEQERELADSLPGIAQLTEVWEFRVLVEQERALEATDRETGQDAWRWEPAAESAPRIEQLANDAEEAAEQVRSLEDWELAVFEAGWQGGGFRQVWDELLSSIRQAQERAEAAAPLIARRGPQLPDTDPLGDVTQNLREIHDFVRYGGSLSRFVLLRHRAWARTLDACSVAMGGTRDAESIAALAAQAELESARERLLGYWNRIAEGAGMAPASTLGPSPEAGARQFAYRVQQLLDWNRDVLGPLLGRAQELGLNLDSLFALSPPPRGPHAEVNRLVDVAGHQLPATLAAITARIHFDAVQTRLDALDALLGPFDRGRDPGGSVSQLRAAVRTRNVEAYERAYDRLQDLHARTDAAQRRKALLLQLERLAPGWARVIRAREGKHGAEEPPGDLAAAWRHRVLTDELTRRASTDVAALQGQIDRLEDDLRRVTGELVNRLAWAAQLDRTSLEQRQSLVGWMQAMARVGRGTGKRAPRLLAAAREYMGKSRSAVPVWIMPLSRVVETFDFRTTRFDVLVIDEASQSDLLALVALYLADQVVIVGDHEQVSPEAVGQRVDQFERLIDQFLEGIPNRELYDGRASIYDFGLSSFGGLVQLKEHFRCVPEIIEFSNQLSYRGTILPLRDASDVKRRPHLVAERVAGRRDGYVNQAEADFIVSAILAACEFDEYQDATFGVISMLEERQARLIDSMLRQRMSPAEFERRRILVGSPPQFQGDERDVIFISLVDSPLGGPLPMRQDDRFRKRYNVAASRAKDQMWVVHSLDPERDLQPGDLRERLIRHATSPEGVEKRIAEATSQAESVFEEQVIEALVRVGYRIESQRRVGAFRIDIVVHGDQNRRVALECDGDRYHTRDDLTRDLSRQALLERLGWRFIRIRGSEYFRDPAAAIDRVRERLESMGIRPTSLAGETR